MERYSDGDEYAIFYTYHIPSEKYKLGQFKTSHFEIEIEEEKGWTITYIPWEDMEGKPRVAGRFKTTKEKTNFWEKFANLILVGWMKSLQHWSLLMIITISYQDESCISFR